jgi:hypothetical protein
VTGSLEPVFDGEQLRSGGSGELAAAYVVDDRPSPWLPIWQAKVRALTTLARMLSLSPGGRVASKPAESHEPVSYYSKLALEQRDERN